MTRTPWRQKPPGPLSSHTIHLSLLMPNKRTSELSLRLPFHPQILLKTQVLGEERAAYGEQIVNALSTQLTAEYGRGFDRRNLFHMVRFAEVFPDEQIVYALRTQLSWTHLRELIAAGSRNTRRTRTKNHPSV